MDLLDVSEATQDIFLRCMHLEREPDPRIMALRKRGFDSYMTKGLRAKVLVDNNTVVGLCQYIPIEDSPFLGSNLLSILCMWVHGYDHGIGNLQHRGYGRFILSKIEEDAASNQFLGVVAWGLDFPYWNPVSFYEHMGYARVDSDGPVILVWKPFSKDATAPSFPRITKTPEVGPDRVNLTVFISGWCNGGCGKCISARDAVKGMEDSVTYREIDTSDRKTFLEWGVQDAVFVDDRMYNSDGPPFTPEMLKAELRATMAHRKAT